MDQIEQLKKMDIGQRFNLVTWVFWLINFMWSKIWLVSFKFSWSTTTNKNQKRKNRRRVNTHCQFWFVPKCNWFDWFIVCFFFFLNSFFHRLLQTRKKIFLFVLFFVKMFRCLPWCFYCLSYIRRRCYTNISSTKRGSAIFWYRRTV